MSRKLFTPLVILAILALALSACSNPRAVAPARWYFPWTWGDQTLAASIEAGCVGGATSTVVADSIYPCPIAETAPAAPPAPVAGTCTKDAQTAAHDDNRESNRSRMSYFGGTSEACYMFGEVNFGLAKQTVLLVIPPKWTVNLNGIIGETFWYRDSDGAVTWSVTDSTANLTRPDGRNEKAPIVVWVNNPDNIETLVKTVGVVYPNFDVAVIPPAK